MMNLFGSSDIDLVSALHMQEAPYDDEEASLSRTRDLLLIVLCAAASIAVYHNCVYFALRTIYPSSFRKNQQLFKKGAYQFTNMSVNLFLGLYGIYHYYASVPQMHLVPITERIRGFPEFAIFGALQTGYNLWSLPIGFVMKEPMAMVGHHIAVLCVGSLSCFSVHGFRYHAPFFFGVIEISSVPLSIMNFCKDNKDMKLKIGKNSKGDFPLEKLGGIIRPIFAITFLLVRVILWSPQILDVLRISGLLGYTCPSGDYVCRTALGSFWLSALFLTLLQFFWGSLVVKGILNAVMGTGAAATTTTKKSD